MEFRYRCGEKRDITSSFMRTPQPRLSLEELRRELEEERIRDEIIARKIAQCRMIEEQRLHEMRMQHALMMPPIIEAQPLRMLPPSEGFGAYLAQQEVKLDERLQAIPRNGRENFSRPALNCEEEDFNKHLRDEGINSSFTRKKKGVSKAGKTINIKIGRKVCKFVERKNGLWCQICDVSCSGEETMVSHLSGKKHLHALKRKRMQKKRRGFN